MCVYVFGNSLLFVVVIYGFRRIVYIVEDKYGSDVWSFVECNFYVDDGLILMLFLEEIVSLMERIK